MSSITNKFFVYASNKLVFAKRKKRNRECRLQSKIYSFLLDNSSKHKKAKVVNKKVVETINDGEYRDVFC